MRTVIAFLAVLFAAAVQADNLHGRLLVYECKQTDAAKDGFRCALEKLDDGSAGLRVHLVSEKDSPERQHKIDLLLVRYMDAGGKVWSVTADHWPKGSSLYCWKGKTPYTTYCDKRGHQ